MKLTKVSQVNRIAVCVPCRDMVNSPFTYSLVQMISYSAQIGIRTNLIMESGSLIARQRQKLAESALGSGASHILWLDSDMIFPPNVLEILLSHGKDIVACNYSTRTTPFKGVAYTKIGDWESWIGYNITGERMQTVEGIGMGCMLVKASVLKSMSMPWFETSYSHELNDHIGEDFYFCQKAIELGNEIWVDTHLSRELSHLGTMGFDLRKTLR